MKRILSTTALLLMLAIGAFAVASDGGRGDMKENGNEQESSSSNTVISINELPANANSVSVIVSVNEDFNPFELQIEFKQAVATDKVKVDVSPIDQSTVEVVVSNIKLENNEPQLYVSPWILVGITEDDLSGSEPIRMQNTNVAIEDPDDAESRLEVINPNPEISIMDIEFSGNAVANGNNTDQASTAEATRTNAGATNLAEIQAANSALNNSDVRVFPNPSTGQFTVAFDTDAQIERLNVMNLLGKVVFSTQMPQTSNNIDLSAVPAGIYFVEATSGNQRVAKRLVIDK